MISFASSLMIIVFKRFQNLDNIAKKQYNIPKYIEE